MTFKTSDNKGLTYFYRIAAVAALIWTVALICSAAWNVHKEQLQTLSLVKKDAISNFNKDQAFRLWGTKHGGVYVTPTEQTPPNLYLSHIPDRDITLPTGKRLTLMNPAYMLRQMMDDFRELYGIKGRITSLRPLNPANAPDAWEREALTAFEKGAKEFIAINEVDGKQEFRLMRPMIVKTGCLKCHAHQGYKEGDIRGGVGISIPMAPYQAHKRKSIEAVLLSHLVIWLLSSTILSLVFYKGKQFILEQVRSQDALSKSEERFRQLFNTATVPLCFINKKGELADFNDSFVQTLGYTHEDVPTLKEGWQLAFPDPEYRSQAISTWEAAVRQAAEKNTGIGPIEYRIVSKSGKVLTLLVSGTIIGDNFIVSLFDITERKKAEGELLKLNEELETRVAERTAELEKEISEREKTERSLLLTQFAVDHAEDSIFWIRPDASFANVNHSTCLKLGYTRDELLGMSVFDVDPAFPREAWDRHWQEIKKRKSFVIETKHRTKAGEVFPVAVSVNYIEYEGTEYNFSFARDITERKRVEDTLRGAKEQLEQKNAELEKANKLFVGRELKMVELKEKIKELEKQTEAPAKSAEKSNT